MSPEQIDNSSDTMVETPSRLNVGSSHSGFREFQEWFNCSRLIWILVFVGVAIRLEQYIFNRSLWLDESLMALNILHRSFRQLTQQLDFHLVGPLAWLFTEKACNLLFGNREMALRLPQILSGVLAMLLIPLLAKRLLPQRAVAVAVGLFALSRPLIYYSSELKPYGSDAFFALLLWLVGFWALERRASVATLVVVALCGVAVTWFSHPVLFVLAGLGVAIVWSAIGSRDWRRLAAFSPVFLLWAASFAVNYVILLKAGSHDPQLRVSYPFLLSIRHFGDVEAIFESIFGLQQNPNTLLLGVAILAFTVGCLYFWRHDRIAFSFLFTPLVFVLLASALHRYPLTGRFYVFFMPALVIAIAAGADQIRLAARSSTLPIATALFVLLFFQPAFSTAEMVMHPMQASELRPVLQYVKQHAQPDDVWYVYCYGRFAFQYYAEVYGLTSGNPVIGSCFRATRIRPRHFYYNWDFFQQDFAKLRGKRVWVIVTHPYSGDGVDEEVLALHVLDNMGTRVDAHAEYGAVAYLYQLRADPIAAVLP